MSDGQIYKQAWDRQWRGDLVSTCLVHADRATGQAAIEGWATFFSQLPMGAKVLDVGTGNGFLPRLALDVSDRLGLKFDIHGSDYAAINPEKAIPDQGNTLSRITFYPEVSNENLPFEDASFDAVTAQHALEYGDLGKSIAEVSRILKAGGRVRFLMHALGGEIVRANTPKIAHCQFVLEEAKLFEVTEAAVRDALAGQGDEGQALKQALSTTANTFKEDANTKDLTELLGLLWGAFEARTNFPDFAAFKTWLDENRAETKAQMARIEAMNEAALGVKAVEALAETMKAAGFADVAHKEERAPEGSTLTGWLVEATKA